MDRVIDILFFWLLKFLAILVRINIKGLAIFLFVFNATMAKYLWYCGNV